MEYEHLKAVKVVVKNIKLIGEISMKNNKGFTLIELLVVVLIIGILAAIAMPQYFKAVEKARGAEALSLFGTIAGAQQRFYLARDQYTEDLKDLDLDFQDKDGKQISSGPSITTTNFNLLLTGGTAGGAKVVACRTSGRYKYVLSKTYDTGRIACGQAVATETQICNSIGNFATEIYNTYCTD